jgi:S1-C subfamily serine protease
MEKSGEIFIWRKGKKEGPISVRALEGAVRFGSIPAETPAWTQGNPEWKTAAVILKEHASLIQSVPIQSSVPTATTKENVRQRARSPRPHFQWWAVGAGLAVICVFFLVLADFRPSAETGPTEKTNISGQIDSPTDDGINASPRAAPVRGAKNASTIEDSEHCVLMARTDQGSGTAFIAAENGRAYVYTNVHVASAVKLEFTDFRGASIPVAQQGEVVGISHAATEESGIDIVRFPLVQPPPVVLNFANRELIEQKPEVWTLGDSGGESILRTLKGRIKGVGPAKIEVDCEFIQGNSGGPIVTANGKVAGIASYMTANQSIWAKGTEQEIRRIGWIPGKNFHWQPTSARTLADERALVSNCMITSDLLIVISMLEIQDSGFHRPDDFPDVAEQVIVMAANHPLRDGIDETSETILALSEKGSGVKAEYLRTYIRFFKSCAAYQESQLEKAAREIRSSFWKNQFDQGIPYHRKVLEGFQSQIQRFEDSGGASETLSAA